MFRECFLKHPSPYINTSCCPLQCLPHAKKGRAVESRREQCYAHNGILNASFAHSSTESWNKLTSEPTAPSALCGQVLGDVGAPPPPAAAGPPRRPRPPTHPARRRARRRSGRRRGWKDEDEDSGDLFGSTTEEKPKKKEEKVETKPKKKSGGLFDDDSSDNDDDGLVDYECTGVGIFFFGSIYNRCNTWSLGYWRWHLRELWFNDHLVELRDIRKFGGGKWRWHLFG